MEYVPIENETEVPGSRGLRLFIEQVLRLFFERRDCHLCKPAEADEVEEEVIEF